MLGKKKKPTKNKQKSLHFHCSAYIDYIRPPQIWTRNGFTVVRKKKAPSLLWKVLGCGKID